MRLSRLLLLSSGLLGMSLYIILAIQSIIGASQEFSHIAFSGFALILFGLPLLTVIGVLITEFVGGIIGIISNLIAYLALIPPLYLTVALLYNGAFHPLLIGGLVVGLLWLGSIILTIREFI